MDPVDHYRVLGVASTASDLEIRQAYLKRIRAAHPDTGGSHDEAQRVNLAYQVLSDPALRERYDGVRTRPDESVDADCPICGRKFIDMSQVSLHLASHVAEWEASSCRICRRQPVHEFRFTLNSGFILFRRKMEFRGLLCRACALGMYRNAQAHNITRGPWGVISFFSTLLSLLDNFSQKGAISRLEPPYPPDAIDRDLAGKPVFARLSVWVVLIGVAVLIGAIVEDAQPTGIPAAQHVEASPSSGGSSSPSVPEPPSSVVRPTARFGQQDIDFVLELREKSEWVVWRSYVPGVNAQDDDLFEELIQVGVDVVAYLDEEIVLVNCSRARQEIADLASAGGIPGREFLQFVQAASTTYSPAGTTAKSLRSC